MYVCLHPPPLPQEFTEYYASGGLSFGGDKDSSDEIRERVVSIAAEPPSWVSLAEIKRITNLQQYTIGEVAECFLSFANNDGMLTRTAFNDVFRELMFTGAHGHAYVCCPAG